MTRRAPLELGRDGAIGDVENVSPRPGHSMRMHHCPCMIDSENGIFAYKLLV